MRSRDSSAFRPNLFSPSPFGLVLPTFLFFMQWHGGIEMSGAQSGVKLPMAATMATRDEHFCRETGKLTFIRESFPVTQPPKSSPAYNVSLHGRRRT